ncbi:hypothetical protein KBZ00_25890 [Streptomyces sp. RK31]|uniref:hypothetical protein n=1 Tax=Streptomyces sp. RK31 TaxID=2824892 RepID=UPI001B378BE9|nr:hypothetical protein [Streptomyces sp. RK31]MBQ0974532.1 hypothetical protein [Streptomyces sp. RK31]
MIHVVAVALLVVLLTAGLCGHAVQPFPLRRVWRRARTALRSRQTAHRAPNTRPGDSSTVTPAPRPSRTPLWARSQPHTYEEAA